MKSTAIFGSAVLDYIASDLLVVRPASYLDSAESEDTVTAIIPTRGRPLLVCSAIRSALAQTHRNLDVIVVIDGPDDATRERVEALDDPRIFMIELDAKAGAAEARNIGVRAAASKWIAFLDDDDEWLPDKIAAQLRVARAQLDTHRKSVAPSPVISSRIIVRTPGYDWISPKRIYLPVEPISEFLFCRKRFFDGARYMQTSTLFMPRSLMLDLPFRAGLERHQDWDWLLRAATYPGVRFHMVADPLTVYRAEPGRKSLGRRLDWDFSEKWAREMRYAFTPRAYAFFIANECVSRAVKAHAGAPAYARLTREYFARGRPTLRSLLSLAGFLCLPEVFRNLARQSARRLRARTDANPSLSASLNA